MLDASRLSMYGMDSASIRERENHLMRLSGELSGRLPPPTREALAACLEGINSYYSNLIEGQGTRPVEAEQALARARQQGATAPAGDLARLALAHIQTERWMRQVLREQPALEISHPDFICELHRRFVSPLPESLRVVRGAHEEQTALNLPGRWRDQEVQVGRHLAPPAAEVPALLMTFHQVWQRLPKTPAHILIAHHRLTWIHPFLDGNGRVARLLTLAMLARNGLDADGLWSLPRGLAKQRPRYYEHLARADAARAGDHDGRGALSLQGAQAFVDFMLGVCEDQIGFMRERLQIAQVEDRMARFCAERRLLLGRDERAAPLLIEALFKGRLRRAEAGTLTGLGERAARAIVAECVEDGLLTATSSRADLTPRYPVYAAAYLFPHLFEIDDPQQAMRETLMREG